MNKNDILQRYPAFYDYYTLLGDYRNVVSTPLLESIPEQFIEALDAEIQCGNISVNAAITTKTKHTWRTTGHSFQPEEPQP
jgi:hypothetical protein